MTTTTQDPAFIWYKRRDNQWNPIETGGIDLLKVPSYLKHESTNPIQIAHYVNDVIICDSVDGRLVPNEDRTTKAKKGLIAHSPRIMRGRGGEKDLWVKRRGLEYLFFDRFKDDAPLELFNNFDYVVSVEAARGYTIKAGICSRKQFEMAKREGKLNFFGGGQPSGLDWSRPNLMLFLLSEIHNL